MLIFFLLLLNFKDEPAEHANKPSSYRQAREVMKEYPPDTPDLSRDLVQLDIPNKLFGQLAPDVALRSSEAIGSLIQVSESIFHFFKVNFNSIFSSFASFNLEYGPSLCGACAIFQAITGQNVDCKRFVSTASDNAGPSSTGCNTGRRKCERS